MSKIISFSELRKIKDDLPEGSILKIAEKLNIPVETVWNYFGGHSYREGQSTGIHLEAGPNEGLVLIEDTTILDLAQTILEEHTI